MTCWTVRSKLPGYLDGALGASDHAQVKEHIGFCADCRGELERYRKLSRLMARVGRVTPPQDLPLRIRAAAAQAWAKPSWGARMWGRVRFVFENVLEPLAVPATGGVLTALLTVVVVYSSLVVGVPLGEVPDDLPIHLNQPARLESLAPFAVTDLGEGNGNGNGGAHFVVVETRLNAKGEVVDYQILSGPDGQAVRRQLDRILMFYRFRPPTSFGQPRSGGRVVLSFGEIHVKG